MELNIDICKDLCYYGRHEHERHFPCKECKNGNKLFYDKGAHPIFDLVYNAGYKRGEHDGICECAPSAD